MKIALVIQRYGRDVNGGAEQHARMLAEELARRHSVEVLTTCAEDYITWANKFSQGTETINGVTVRRFRVAKKRNVAHLAEVSQAVFRGARHTMDDERLWFELNGPYAPDLLDYIEKERNRYDWFLFMCFRYFQTSFGLPKAADKAILFPIAENEPSTRLRHARTLFQIPAAAIFFTPEERQLVMDCGGNPNLPYRIIGSGLQLPKTTVSGADFRRKTGIEGPYFLYLGRIDPNKGCDRMFKFFTAYMSEYDDSVPLLLIGGKKMPVPEHPGIIPVGYLSEEEKYAAIRECEVLIMPSFYESLSLVILEAWSQKKPVLVNARCEVLKGQVTRSDGGLFYNDYTEFAEALTLLRRDPALGKKLGASGCRYYVENYLWDRIIDKIDDLLDELSEREKASE